MDLIVVGAGWAGEQHARAIRALEAAGTAVHLAALVDVDKEHLLGKAAELGAPDAFTDLGDALQAHPEAAGVVIATPHNLHRPHTAQAAAAGRHVLVEKPMALTLRDADAMIEACRRAGTTLMVAESVRYSRVMMAVRHALESGRIGQVLSGRVNFIARGRHTYAYPGRRAWLAQPRHGGSGIWMLNGIHVMSAARMIFGEVRRVTARAVSSDLFESETEATVVALLEFDTDAVATLTVSAELHGYGRFGDLAVFGSEGTLWCNWRKGGALHLFSGQSEEPQTVEFAADEQGGASGSFVRQMEEFVDAATSGREPCTDGPGERATLAAVLAGYESMRTGCTVAPH